MSKLSIKLLAVLIILSVFITGCNGKDTTPQPESPSISNPASETTTTQPTPAEFEVVSIVTDADKIAVGEAFNITAEIANNGGTEGVYPAILKVNGNETDSKEINISAGNTGEASFTLTLEDTGTYTLDVGGTATTVNVLQPAEIEVISLDVAQELILPGEETEVKANIKNAGELAGTLEPILKVNGVEVDSRRVVLEPDSSEELSFSFIRDVPGDYKIELNDASTSVKVEDTESYQHEGLFFSIPYPKGLEMEEYSDGAVIGTQDEYMLLVWAETVDASQTLDELYESRVSWYEESYFGFKLSSSDRIEKEGTLNGWDITFDYLGGDTLKLVKGHARLYKAGPYFYTVQATVSAANEDDYGALLDACLRSFSLPVVAVDSYTDTTTGYTLELPRGWSAIETGDDNVPLRMQTKAGVPIIFGYVFNDRLFEDTMPEEHAAAVANAFSEMTGYKVVSHGAANLGQDTEGYEYVFTNTEEGFKVKRRVASVTRGSQALTLMIYTLDTTYQSYQSKIDQLFGSFTLIERRPFGVSRQDSLFLYEGEIVTLDPALSESSPADIIGAIFSGLVKHDKDMNIVPDLAEKWEVNEDGTVYTFYIREDARFHDGKPVTAQDFKYSWERACDPDADSPTALSYLGDIVGVKEMLDGEAQELEGVRIIDDYTLEVTIDGPKPYFLGKLAYITSYVVDRANVERGMNWTDNPNGTGPFKLKEWQKNTLLILERNEDYYGDVAKLENIVFQIFSGIPMMMYENGEIDLTSIGMNNLDRVLDPENPLNAEYLECALLSLDYLGFNIDTPPFDDPNVRRAFAMALDIDKLLEVSLKGIAEKAAGYIPAGVPGHNEALEPLPYDPEQALQLISASKYGSVDNLPPVTLYTLYGLADYQEAAIGMWQQYLGVTVEVEVIDEYEEWLERGHNREFQLWFSGWRADYLDPQNFLDMLFHSESEHNKSGYSEVDEALEAAAVERDEQKRIEMYQAIEEQILEDLPLAPLWQSEKRNWVVKPYVRNFLLLPIGVNQWADISVEPH